MVTETKSLLCDVKNSCLMIVDVQEKLSAVMPEKVINRLKTNTCLLYTSPSPRDGLLSRMPSSA